MSKWLQESSFKTCENLKDSLLKCDLSASPNDIDLDKLLVLARDKINIFPFHEVDQKWLQLFVDVNISQAHKILSALPPDQWTSDQNKQLDTQLTQATTYLDNALIIAGGQSRRDDIHLMFTKIQDNLPDSRDERPAKRPRTIEDILPDELSFVPKIEHPIDTLSEPSIESFQQCLSTNSRPMKLPNILDSWPAQQKWKSIRFWQNTTLNGRRLVPVEIGQSYNDEDWRQEIMPFRRFMCEFILNETSAVGYLAQHDLMAQMSQLRNDILVPDYCYCEIPSQVDNSSEQTDRQESSDDIHQNIWFGGRTVSPLHHDPYHNILCQVHGTKYVRLYSPKYSANLYPRSTSEVAPHANRDERSCATIDMSNNSNIDIYAMELSPHEDWDETWPGLSDVPYVECLLEAGQALYIPKGWWHYVRSVSASGISVSFWW